MKPATDSKGAGDPDTGGAGNECGQPATDAPGQGAVSPAVDAWEARFRRELELAGTASAAPGRASGGRRLQSLYTASDLGSWEPHQALGYPGSAPFTRGPYSSMFRGKLWTMRQYAGFATAEQSNERFHYLLNRGQTGLSIAFDLPTQIGYDSDHQMARGEVGRVGVAVDSVHDMEVLFRNIDLSAVTTSMTINATAATLLALYCALAERRGVPIERLRGTIQNDILKEYVARGTYIYGPKPSMRLVTDVFEFCARRVPLWNTISISGYHIREAGATAAQEVAFTLANGLAYVEAGVAAGLQVDEFAPRLSFFFNAHNHFLEEIAKFRAARRLWARLMKERFGARDPRALRLRFHAQTGGSTLTAQQPLNNVVRVAVQALAAVLGGCQSLHTNGMDEALSLPTEAAAKTALRTQQLLAYEHGAGDVIDALGGAYAVERLTDQLQEEAEEILRSVDEIGGMVAAIEGGAVQRQIEESAYETQMAVESDAQRVVGVNCFVEDASQGSSIETHTIPAGLEEARALALARLREERDRDAVSRSLDRLSEVASTQGNLVDATLDAVRNQATLGEVADRMRDVFGEYRDPTVA